MDSINNNAVALVFIYFTTFTAVHLVMLLEKKMNNVMFDHILRKVLFILAFPIFTCCVIILFITVQLIIKHHTQNKAH